MDLLSTKRASDALSKGADDKRLEFDRDFDRILFSAPVRRLADKTQVFPMETNDSVRTRLTHSHEVSNLCRSLALQILRSDGDKQPFGYNTDLLETVPVISAAVGLAHDLGNPPFGHQGETAVRDWFENKRKHLFEVDGDELNDAFKRDFLDWEGNAQAFRLVTKLQVSKGRCGLNLTYATLASLMKYTVSSNETTKDAGQHPAKKKFGYFQDDKEFAQAILQEVGLEAGKRHPIAYVMEACDDIAYSSIDVEDAVSKELVSLNDVLVMLQKQEDDSSQSVFKRVEEKLDALRADGRSIADIKDIGLQYFRSFAIEEMVIAARVKILESETEIRNGIFNGNLVDKSKAGQMCQALKDFALENAFQSPKVTALELRGANMLHKLMNYFWRGITEASLAKKTSLCRALEKRDIDVARLRKSLALSEKPTMFGKYAFHRISTNYRANFEDAVLRDPSPKHFRYQQLLLLTDMVSGMTEDFVEATFNELRNLDYNHAHGSEAEKSAKEKS